MKDEIRMGISLPSELEEELFDIQGEAWELMDDGRVDEAVEKIKSAWHKVPEPKFNTSCSDTVLTDLVEMLNLAEEHEAAEAILLQWINDIETCGYKVIQMTPFILLGETYLYVGEVDKAKAQFYQAVKHGASARAFSDEPPLYFEIAQKKVTNNEEIISRFAELLTADDDDEEEEEDDYEGGELPEEISDRVNDAAEAGNQFIEDEQYAKAIAVWKEALALIPEPKNTFAETHWFEVSIGDAYFLQDDFKNAFDYFETAKGSIAVNAYENPFIMLRVGQLHFEAGRLEEAKEYLLRAYMAEGEDIFENDDPKYFEYLKTNADLEQ